MIKLIIVALFEKRKRLLVLSLDHLTKMYSEPKLRFLFSFSCKLDPYRASVSLSDEECAYKLNRTVNGCEK
jgi:hypothetical protein